MRRAASLPPTPQYPACGAPPRHVACPIPGLLAQGIVGSIRVSTLRVCLNGKAPGSSPPASAPNGFAMKSGLGSLRIANARTWLCGADRFSRRHCFKFPRQPGDFRRNAAHRCSQLALFAGNASAASTTLARSELSGGISEFRQTVSPCCCCREVRPPPRNYQRSR